MKAFVYERYGGPEVLQLREVPKPVPGEGEVLIKLAATCVNPADWHVMRADPFFARFATGLFRPKNKILGTDAAGTVDAVGPGVTRFKAGDAVYADLYQSGGGLGGFAEYAIAKEAKTAPTPKSWSLEEAAAMPMVGLTALAGFRKYGGVKPGQSILINGASGGIGHVAVQMAKAMGATVTGVTSTKNAEFVTGLGADDIIDYTQEDFAKSGKRWDLVMDTVGNKSVGELRGVLTEDGHAAVIGFSAMGKLLGIALRGGKRIGIVQVDGKAEDLAYLNELADAGKLKPTIEKTYPFAELPAAIARLETGRVRGKLVVKVG